MVGQVIFLAISSSVGLKGLCCGKEFKGSLLCKISFDDRLSSSILWVLLMQQFCV